jgi:pyruvate/2-oxoglutarate dehydrogenase complex dihydrolipoamide acyltransferase (E2) component
VLTVEVTNTLGREVFRAGHLFSADAKGVSVEIDPNRLAELTDCAHLEAKITGADSLAEIPPGAPIEANATPEAYQLARDAGLNVFALKGTGSGGRVLLSNVEKALSGGDSSDGVGDGGGGEAVTTDDPLEYQRRVAEEAIEAMISPNEGDAPPDSPVPPFQEREAPEG